MRRIGTFAPLALATVLAAACTDRPMVPQSTKEGTSAPIVDVGSAETIPHEYIVEVSHEVLNLRELAEHIVEEFGGQVLGLYTTTAWGFAIRTGPAGVAFIRSNPHIDRLIPNHFIRTNDLASDRGRIFAGPLPPSDLNFSGRQYSAPAHLARIDQRDLLPQDATYEFDDTGAGVNIYIIGTGVDFASKQFLPEGRTFHAYDGIDGTHDDCVGHGTEVAKYAAGSATGVAKEARIYAVRVIGCDKKAVAITVANGVEWVANNHIAPAVANISWFTSQFIEGEGFVNQWLDDRVRAATAAGVLFTIASNNYQPDDDPVLHYCSGFSPSRITDDDVLVVGASYMSYTDTQDLDPFEAIQPNTATGPCVDIFAPSTQGTSFAAPQVAGVAALYLERYPTATPLEVAQAIISASSYGKLSSGDFAGAPNRLLYSRIHTGILRTRILGPANPQVGTSASWTAAPSGGTPPYSHLWYVRASGDNEWAATSSSATYSTMLSSVAQSFDLLLITESAGNIVARDTLAVVPQPPTFSVSVFGPTSIPVGVAGCQYQANISGGAPPYEYEWSLVGAGRLAFTVGASTEVYATRAGELFLAVDVTSADGRLVHDELSITATDMVACP